VAVDAFEQNVDEGLEVCIRGQACAFYFGYLEALELRGSSLMGDVTKEVGFSGVAELREAEAADLEEFQFCLFDLVLREGHRG
jgi:hypothetical protein